MTLRRCNAPEHLLNHQKYSCYVQPTFIVNCTLYSSSWKMGNMFIIISLVIIDEIVLSSSQHFISQLSHVGEILLEWEKARVVLLVFPDFFFPWGFLGFFTFRAPLLMKCGIDSLSQFRAALPLCRPSGSNDAFESACCVNRLFYFLLPYKSFYVVVKEDYNVFIGSHMPSSCKSAARQTSWIRFLASIWMSLINKSLLKGAAFVKQNLHLLFLSHTQWQQST